MNTREHLRQQAQNKGWSVAEIRTFVDWFERPAYPVTDSMIGRYLAQCDWQPRELIRVEYTAVNTLWQGHYYSPRQQNLMEGRHIGPAEEATLGPNRAKQIVVWLERAPWTGNEEQSV